MRVARRFVERIGIDKTSIGCHGVISLLVVRLSATTVPRIVPMDRGVSIHGQPPESRTSAEFTAHQPSNHMRGGR
jgi:hypothetical protein